jgi:hypothetical protein
LQDFQQFGNDISSSDYNDTLNAMQYMQSQRQPQPMNSGLNMLPQVTVPMQEGGGMEQAMMQEQMMQQQQPEMSPEMQQEMMQRQNTSAVAQEQLQNLAPEEIQQYESEVAELQEAAKGLAGLGREGDTELVHMTSDELKGLMSLGQLTYNPMTGLPEAFSLKGFTRIFSPIRMLAKPIKNVMKSKAFRTIAPIALAIAAPYALPHLAAAAGMGTVGAAGAAGTGLAGFLGGSSIGAAALTSGLGSLAGNLITGRSFKDSAKAALITGATAGLTKGIGNKMAGKTFFSGQEVNSITGQPVSSAVQASKDAAIESSIKGAPKSGYENLNVGDGVTQSGSSPLLGDYNVANAQPNAVDMAIQQGNNMPTLEQTLSAKPGFIPDPKINQALIDGTKLASSPPEPTFLSKTATGLGDAKDAVVSGVTDRYRGLGSFDKGAIMNLGKDVLTADIGSSMVDASNAQQAAEQAAEDQQLAQAGFSVSYPSGFGTQRVIRDSSGVVSNLSAADILSRALGGGRNQFVARTSFAPTAVAAQGGLIQLAQGGEFSGMVPGDGGGMEDNVYMPIKEGPEQVGTLAVSPSEYVVDSYTMAALGNGNPAEGARVMDDTIKQVRKQAYGSTQQPNEINGLSALRPMAQGV